MLHHFQLLTMSVRLCHRQKQEANLQFQLMLARIYLSHEFVVHY
jgi:hypothetical protein